MADVEGIPEGAPHVFILGEGGAVIKMGLPLHETITDRLLKGYLTRVANAKGDPYVAPEPDATGAGQEPAVAGLPTERPAITDSKPEWVGWAVAESTRLGEPITPDDAEALTKTDLIERYGVTPAPIEPVAATE